MKISKKILEDIIKEEITNLLKEQKADVIDQSQILSMLIEQQERIKSLLNIVQENSDSIREIKARMVVRD